DRLFLQCGGSRSRLFRSSPQGAHRAPLPPLHDSLRADAAALGRNPSGCVDQAVWLDESPLCCSGAPRMKLAHSASLDPEDRDAGSEMAPCCAQKVAASTTLTSVLSRMPSTTRSAACTASTSQSLNAATWGRPAL